RDEGRDSEEEGGNRSGAAPRQRGDVHRQQDQVEYSRTRGIVDPADRLRLAHRAGDLAGAYAGGAAQRARPRSEGGHDRRYPEVRGRLLQLENGRPEVTKQLEVGRHAAPDRDVPLQVADACVASRNRPELRREASLDRYSLDP